MITLRDLSKPVLIAGPTACGKSSLALSLARKHNGIVVNADALQVYSCWQILSARPSAEDEAAAPHMLYGHVGTHQKYSVGHWLKDIAETIAAHPDRLVIVVGGTGLYFTALTEGLADIPPVPDDIRAQSEALFDGGGLDQMLTDLAQQDRATLQSIDQQNPARVRRAWEVLMATGMGLSAWQATPHAPVLPLALATRILIDAPKAFLSPRINARFDSMMDGGAIDECRAVLPAWDPALPSMRALGASQIISYLQGDIDLATATDLAKTATHQFAKRQRNWFRSRMKTWDILEVININTSLTF